MDPRMDSGMDLPLEELPEDERATSDTQFDPTCALRYDEVCWIMDRALACEVRARGLHLCPFRSKLNFCSLNRVKTGRLA